MMLCYNIGGIVLELGWYREQVVPFGIDLLSLCYNKEKVDNAKLSKIL